MAALLTKKQLDARKSEPVVRPQKRTVEASKDVSPVPSSKFFVLQFPEIPMDGPAPNFLTQWVDGAGEVHRIIVKNGIVRTYDAALAEHLRKKGYLMLREEEAA